MKPVKIGIIEDEIIIADGISESLNKLGYEIAGIALDYDSALDLIESKMPDILIVDINLKDKYDGIDIGFLLKERYRKPFIYLTANSEKSTVDRAKLTNPAGFLVKPFTKEEIYATIEVCLCNYSASNLVTDSTYLINDSLFIKSGTFYNKLKFEDILYVEADHVYVVIVTKTQKILVRNTLQNFIKHVGDNVFYQIHRKYAVNINYIDSINTEVILINGNSIPIGRTFRDGLLQKLRLG